MEFHEVSRERWQQAQEWEKDLWLRMPADGDDWNNWWADQFDRYSFLRGQKIRKVLEVGCGPWARNTRWVLSVIGAEDKEIYLEDPLLSDYVAAGKLVGHFHGRGFAVPLEELSFEPKVDLIICVNVLDHVFSLEKCMANMFNQLEEGGILVLGQDLTNEEDFKRCPEVVTDIGHPIKVDLETCTKYLTGYEPIFDRVLGRDQGRNPAAHYATLLFAGKKRSDR